MTRKNIEKKAKETQEKLLTIAETAKTSLKPETLDLIKRSKWHSAHNPYTDIPNGIMTFHVTYATYNSNVLIVQGVIHPYRKPDKAANFLYMAVGKHAVYNISDIMERYSAELKQARKVYQILHRINKQSQYPLWTEPVSDVIVDDMFIVKAKHYNGQLQLDFATWRFQKDIEAIDLSIQLGEYYK